MRGVPHQGDATISPAVDRIAVIHTRNKGGVDLLHHLARTRLDVAKRALQLLDVAALGPGLALDFSRRNRCENAVEIVWSNPIGDERATGSKPVISLFLQVDRAQPICRDQRTPHQDIRKLRLFLAAELLSNEGINAVRTDQRIATQPFAGSQLDRHPVSVMLEPEALRPKPQNALRNGFGKNVDQVGAMNVIERRAPALSPRITQGRHIEQLAIADISHLVCRLLLEQKK